MIDKLKKDIIECMKNKNHFRLLTLREVKGAMDLEHINKNVELNDELLIDVVGKQIKMRNESLKDFTKANREDLINKVKEEIVILEEYLPKQLSSEELQEIIDSVFNKVKPEKPSDMGKIMKELTPLVKGKALMQVVSSLVKDKLNSIGK